MSNYAFTTATALVAATLWAAVSPGCSSQSMPPALGCDAGCSFIAAGGAGGGESSADAAACTSSPADTSCIACAKVSCCESYSVWLENSEATSLSACEASCADASCVAGCEQQHPDGVSDLTQLDSCLGTSCLSCTELGVGDPCTTSAQGACETGLTCNGLWCTTSCAVSSSCKGLGASGANALGEQSACVGTATAGDVCFPGCAISPADCAPFPGTACFSTMSVDGLTVAVCESVPDAGAD